MLRSLALSAQFAYSMLPTSGSRHRNRKWRHLKPEVTRKVTGSGGDDRETPEMTSYRSETTHINRKWRHDDRKWPESDRKWCAIIGKHRKWRHIALKCPVINRKWRHEDRKWPENN